MVGNSAYEHASPLPNPVNDARLIAQTLEDLDFDVDLHQDLTRIEIASKLSTFLKKTEGADLTLFYFAGHGMQFNGQNYLLGTNAQLRSELDIEAETLNLDQVTRLLRQGSRAALVFVDACRDNPLATAFYRDNFSPTRAIASRGLAAPAAAFEGAMVTFAASPGQAAFDGENGNSPFALALAEHFPATNTEILTLMKRVIRDVKRATGDQQVPMVSNDLAREIYLNLDNTKDATAIAAAEERALYDAALSLNSERAFDIFLSRYPEGEYRDLALAAREALVAEALAEQSGTSVEDGVTVAVSREVAADTETALGMSRDDAIAIQHALNALGYKAGIEDGVLGPASRKAIADFQAAAGLPSTGVATQGTASALGVDIGTEEQSDTPVYSSRNARQYDPDELALVESDPRLIAAARELVGEEFTYGFFDGRLYLAILTWRNDPWAVSQMEAKRLGGNLATITSAAENSFLFRLVKDDPRFWHTCDSCLFAFGPSFGLVQAENALEPAGGWSWVTGEPFDFVAWLPGEPSNSGGAENFASFMYRNRERDDGGPDTNELWGDLDSSNQSLIIEID